MKLIDDQPSKMNEEMTWRGIKIVNLSKLEFTYHAGKVIIEYGYSKNRGSK